MAEFCLTTSSSTSVPVLFHKKQCLYKSNKECLSIVPCSGRKQKNFRFRLRSKPLVGDPVKSMGWLFSDQFTNIYAYEEQPILAPHFPRMNTDESHFNIHASPMKRGSRRTGQEQELREQELCRRSNFHACETLLSLVLYKDRKSAILFVKKFSPELSQLLTKFSARIAGTGLATLFSVACKVSSGRTPIYASTVLNTGVGSVLVWLSWAVNNLRDTIVCIGRNSSKVSVNDEEMMRKVDKNVNEIFFRAATLIVVVVLRFA